MNEYSRLSYDDHLVALTPESSLTLFLTIHPNHSSFLADLPNYIQCPHKLEVRKSLLVSHHLPVYEQDSIKERCL